jgi:hypothetical protein
MTMKKINGYSIYLKDLLGKGSFGSVPQVTFRSIVDNKTVPNDSVQSKY